MIVDGWVTVTNASWLVFLLFLSLKLFHGKMVAKLQKFCNCSFFFLLFFSFELVIRLLWVGVVK